MVSGTNFRPTCKEECQCLDGSIGCLIKCPQESQVPSPEVCPNARLQSVEDQCCSEWVCDALPHPQGSVSGPVWYDGTDIPNQNTLLGSEMEAIFSNEVDTDVVYEWNGGEDGDELTEQEIDLLYSTQSTGDNHYDWEETNRLPGEGKLV